MTLEELNIPIPKTTNRIRCWKFLDGLSWEETFDHMDNLLTSNDTFGDWYEKTYDERGNQLTFEDSRGYWNKKTYDDYGNELTHDSGYKK